MITFNRNTVLFLGSGISIFQSKSGDAGLPMGQEIVNSVLDRLFSGWFETKHPNDEFFKTYLADTPFEIILEYHPRREQVQQVISDFFKVKSYNLVHETIAKLIKSGNISAVITTNYDNCLETAIAEITGIPPSSIVSQKSIPEEWGNVLPLFKIHGSAGDPDSIIATLSSEYRLPEWKFELLENLIKGNDVTILGFSGRDFDVCPALFSDGMLNNRQLCTWVEPSNDPSANLVTAIEKEKATLRKENFAEFFENDELNTLDLSNSSADELIVKLFDGVTKHEIRQWQFLLLDTLSLCRYMEVAIDKAQREKSIDDYKLNFWRSDVLECKGQYYDSIIFLEKRIMWARSNCDYKTLIDDEQSKISRYYTSGNFVTFTIFLFLHKIWLYTWGCIYPIPMHQVANAHYLLGLFFKGLFRAFSAQGINPVAKIFRYFGIRTLNRAANEFYNKPSDWSKIYLCQIQAEDMKTSINLSGHGASHFIASASRGFMHLNNFVAPISAMRKQDKRALADINYVLKLVDRLEWLHLYPEVWKISAELDCSNYHDKDFEIAQDILKRGLRCLDNAQISPWVKRRIKRKIQGAGSGL